MKRRAAVVRGSVAVTAAELADALRGLDAAELAAMIASNTQVMIAQGEAILRLKADLTAHFDATAKQVASIIRERDEARGLLRDVDTAWSDCLLTEDQADVLERIVAHLGAK